MSKYGLAKSTLAELENNAHTAGIDKVDAYEALLIMTVQNMKELEGVRDLRGLLQYEIDSLGSGGVHEIQRGGGHS